jgi:hypothetical protein
MVIDDSKASLLRVQRISVCFIDRTNEIGGKKKKKIKNMKLLLFFFSNILTTRHYKIMALRCSLDAWSAILMMQLWPPYVWHQSSIRGSRELNPLLGIMNAMALVLWIKAIVIIYSITYATK